MVSSISAVVGGIVIMNVMLVSVTQRTREIGVRRAVGATKADILRQFLTESLLQCLIGGAIGIGIGFGCALALRDLHVVSGVGARPGSRCWAWSSVPRSGSSSESIPARKAANLDPGDRASRTETG